MSSFSPTTWTMEPQDRPDDLAGAVLHSLSRPLARRRPWGPIKTFILAGISFGLLPLIIWPRRLRRYVSAEQLHLWHLTEWLRLRSGTPQAMQLRDSVQEMGTGIMTQLFPLVMVVLLVVRFFPLVTQPGFIFRDLLDATYFYIHPHFHSMRYYFPTWRINAHLNLAWTLLLSAGYLFHFIVVQRHAGQMAQFVRDFNTVAAKEGMAPLAIASGGFASAPLWLIAAILGVCFGAPWAIFAALAGAAQARYIRRTSRLTRIALAHGVRDILSRHRPAMNVPMPARLRAACGNRLCRAPLPPGAAYCPRCGTPGDGRLNKIV